MTAARLASLLPFLLPVLLESCSTRTWFRPREGVTAESPDGRPAAQYTLVSDSGTRFGTLRVWSNGVDYDTSQQGDPLVLDLSFEVENVSDQVLVLDREGLVLQGLDPAPSPPREFQPRRAMAPFETAPGSMLRADFAFDLGVELTPDDLQAFSVRWTVRTPDGTSFRDITPFRRDSYAYYYPYDPYWYGYWGWGYSWCW